MPSRDHQKPVKRWSDSAGGDPAAGNPAAEDRFDAHLGEMFRALPPVEGLATDELLAVGRRLRAHTQGRSKAVGLRGFLVVLAVLVGGSGTAFAKWGDTAFWQKLSDVVSVITSTPSVTQPAVPKQASVRRVTPSPAIPDEPQETPSVLDLPGAGDLPPSTGEGSPLSNSKNESDKSRTVASRQSLIALESKALEKALTKLRRDHDPLAALRLLDAYQAQFPQGQLAIEAAAARVDALLLLRRNSDALALLARLPLERSGRKSELQLLRAELYAERDCHAAQSDFDALLQTAPARGFHERALHGRAACLLRLGNNAGARRDLEVYLELYPNGRFAPQARERLAAP